MRKKNLFFAALFLAALTFGFVGCENPNGDLLNNGDDSSITDNDSTTNNPDQGGDNNGGTKPTTPEAPTLVATGGASDVEYSTVTLWGRINTDTLWAFPNIKWGIECSTSKEEMQSHKGKKALCTTDLVGENSDEYSVAFTELTGGKMLYYNAYLVINDMKYIYGEADSVHLDVKLTLNRNNTSYGTVTGSGTYDHLAEVTITATPKENYYFTSWSDGNTENPRTVVVNSDTTITANFAKKPYLTVKSNNTSYGTVTGSGYYMPGDEATITATPKRGFVFKEWNDENTDNPRTLTVTGNLELTAIFDYAYVDLGLPSGLKWATCNVGATKPEEYGNYYAWGETKSKSYYYWDAYKWATATWDGHVWDLATLTKYNTSSEYGTVDNKTVLDLEDDAARANWGGAWRMPTDAECTELLENCTWTWTSDYNGTGVAGRIVTGTNGNSIFLPAAGFRNRDDLYDAGSNGIYWSSSLGSDDPDNAWYVSFSSDGVSRYNCSRFYGHSVRPVLGE